MNDSRTPKRSRATDRSRRAVQKTFPVLLAEAGDDPGEAPAWEMATFPYRAALANWPDAWRERWGHRANALEEEGLGWQDAEARAFREIQGERQDMMDFESVASEEPELART